MSTRIAFLSTAAVSSVPFDEIGHADFGTWGRVEDDAWLAADAHDPLELLFLSPVEYQHAVRGLHQDEVAGAVAHRRKRFGPASRNTLPLHRNREQERAKNQHASFAGYTPRGAVVIPSTIPSTRPNHPT